MCKSKHHNTKKNLKKKKRHVVTSNDLPLRMYRCYHDTGNSQGQGKTRLCRADVQRKHNASTRSHINHHRMYVQIPPLTCWKAPFKKEKQQIYFAQLFCTILHQLKKRKKKKKT